MLVCNKLANSPDCGFTKNDLLIAKHNFEEIGCNCELFDLRDCVITPSIKEQLDEAYILIIHGAVDNILKDIDKTVDDLLNEQKILDVDKKAKMYGRVVNKHARYNLCFSEESQELDNKKLCFLLSILFIKKLYFLINNQIMKMVKVELLHLIQYH